MASDSGKETDFKADISAKKTYGKYSWCGSMLDSGYYLDILSNQESTILSITIEMNNKLYKETEFIQVYHDTSCIQYTSEKLKKTHTFLFPLYKDIDKVKINFVKGDYENYDTNSLKRLPMKTYFSQTINLPKLEIKGSRECIICTEEIKDDKYITKCQHVFHTQCIFDYLKHNDLLYVQNSCRWCKHGEKIKEFKCPTCRQLVNF